MNFPEAVSIREVGPRDGLQNEEVVETGQKIQLIEMLSAAGLTRIETVSFVRPDTIPQMADAEEVWSKITKNPSIVYSALVLNTRGAERAVACEVNLVQFALSASETHNLKNAGRSLDQSLAELADVVNLARGTRSSVHATISTAWGCPYEGVISQDRVVEIARRVVESGVSGISLGDTTGIGTPRNVASLVGQIIDAVGTEIEVNAHFHDTRGCGLANVLAAMDSGCRSFDASIGGLGGCPYAPGASGNICTEDLIYMLDEMEIHTGISLDALISAAEFAESLTGRRLPGHLLRAGWRSGLTA